MIRLACLDDVDKIYAIAKDSFSDNWSKEAYAESIGNQQSVVLVAEESDSKEQQAETRQKQDAVITGFAVCNFAADQGSLDDIAVASAFRGRGIGQELLEGVVSQLLTKGVNEIFLEVRESNKVAISLYEKKGFSQIGIRKNFYRDPVENALLLQCSLKNMN